MSKKDNFPALSARPWVVGNHVDGSLPKTATTVATISPFITDGYVSMAHKTEITAYSTTSSPNTSDNRAQPGFPGGVTISIKEGKRSRLPLHDFTVFSSRPAALCNNSGLHFSLRALNMSASSIPNVVSIAGVDPSGGAGIIADIRTFSAFGCFPTAACRIFILI